MKALLVALLLAGCSAQGSVRAEPDADAAADAAQLPADAAVDAPGEPTCHVEPCKCEDGYQSSRACSAGVYGACACTGHARPDAAAPPDAGPVDSGSDAAALWGACDATCAEVCVSGMCTFLCETAALPSPVPVAGAQERCAAAGGQCVAPGAGKLAACLPL